MNRLVDALFARDIWVNFRLGYYDRSRGCMVWSKAAVARRYARSWLAVDLVSVVPFDVVALALAVVLHQLVKLELLHNFYAGADVVLLAWPNRVELRQRRRGLEGGVNAARIRNDCDVGERKNKGERRISFDRIRKNSNAPVTAVGTFFISVTPDRPCPYVSASHAPKSMTRQLQAP